MSGELLLLAVASAFWPILIAVVLVALRSPHPAKLLASFYAGALLTTVTVGLVVVYALQATALVTSSRPAFDPWFDIVVGLLALVGAFVLRRRQVIPARTREAPVDEKGPTWWETLLERGARLAFVAAIVLNVFPGFFPLVALKDIAELDYGVAGTAALILGFYLVMFVFIEIPLVGYLVAPARTRDWATRFNDGLDRNARTVATSALAVAGTYLLLRGIISSVT